MDAGRKAYEKGQYDKAIKEYLKVVKEDPKDVRVWLKIGDLYARKDAKLEATDTYLKVAKFYSDQGFYLKAVAVYKQILKVDPRLVEVNLKLAELYRQLGLLSDAMQHFEMVAAFFHREGKTREALQTLRQLVDLDSDNVATRIKLAELYSKEEMLEEAIAEFATTCEFLRKKGRQDDFVKVAERLLFHDQENIELCQELATLYLQRNDPRRALAKLQICFKANQSDPNVLALLAQAFQSLDQKAKTISVLKELARVHTDSGKREEARGVHEKILGYVPDDPDSLAFLGKFAQTSSSVAPPVAPSAAPPPLGSSDMGMGRTTGAIPLIQAPVDDGTAGGRQDAESDLVADLELELGGQSAYEQSGNDGAEAQESADEIVKILTETDVYVKYGLHQKAIDHLRRIFDIDARNIEARERLQDILIKEGREAEGIRELQILAEHTVATNPQQSLSYLRIILSLDGGNVEAHAFSEHHRLDVGSGTAPPMNNPAGELLVADEGDSVGSHPSLAVRSDPVSAVQAAPATAVSVTPREDVDYDFGLEGTSLDGGALESTSPGVPDNMSMAPGQLENALGVAEGDDDELDFALEPPSDLLAVGSSADQYPVAGVPVNSSSDFEGENTRHEAEFIEEIGSEDIEELDLGDLLVEEDGAAGEGLGAEVYAESNEGNGATNLEDDLEEADFFIGQAQFDMAQDILADLEKRYPNNPLVVSKLEELQQVMSGGVGGADEANLLGDLDDSFMGNFGEATGHDMAPPQHLEETAPAIKTSLRGPSVVLETPIDESDSETHFDLGLAYKEMGLFTEAVAAFQKVMDAPGREVQCRLMIGLCHREQQSLSESISQFKAGLYVNDITGPEKFSLYYEIGFTYEELQDPQEALYYYEMVLKKEPDYRDVAERTAAIKSSM